MRLELEPRVAQFPLVQDDNRQDAFSTTSSMTSWDFDSLLKKGVAAAQSGDRDEARKLLSQATAVNPASEDGWMWLASISEYPEELLAFLNRVLEINPTNDRAVEWRSATTSLLANSLVQRALAARNEGSFALAEQCLDQALVHDTKCETAWYWKASLAQSDDQKLEFYSRVLDINPGNEKTVAAVAEINHARVLSSLEDTKALAANDPDAAIKILDELVTNEAKDVQESAWMMMSEIAESDDQKLEYLANVLDINPDNLRAADMVGMIKRSRSRLAFGEAKAAAAAGNRAKAAEILDGFVKDVPDSVDAWLLKSHLSVGLDEKIAALEKALEIDPENTAARSGLSFLALTFGSNSEPEPVVAECSVNEPSNVDADQCESVAELADDELDDAADLTYQPVAESDVEPYMSSEEYEFDEVMAFEPVRSPEIPEFNEEIAMPEPEFGNDILDYPDSEASANEVFGTPIEQEPVGVESMSPPVHESTSQNPFSFETSHSPFDEIVDETFNVETELFGSEEAVAAVNFCPFCSSPNDVQAFECSSCNATLTLSDIEKLLTNNNADQEIVQRSVTEMEAEWNSRDFSEPELIALGIGHFNLGNSESGFRYLQEASRLNSNNVILGGQVNTIAIRLDEMRRQYETHDAMPKGKTILVVDDSPTVRKLISGKLEKSGHHVVCAVDGIEALAKLEEGMPDLVLLDITMPRMDGYEVCKQIRSNPAGKNLPVVMISGKDGFFDKVRGRMAGTSGYVTKPFGPETLMKALETYLLPDAVEAG